MLEHTDAVKHVDEILSVPGIDATLIGPYDLSASMGLAAALARPIPTGKRKRRGAHGWESTGSDGFDPRKPGTKGGRA